MSDFSSADATQRAQRFAKLLQEFRQNIHQPLTTTTGEALPPLAKRRLAQLLGVSPTLINKYERAEIDPFDIRWGLINRVAELTGLSLEELKAVLSGQKPSVNWERPLQAVSTNRQRRSA